MKKAQKHSYLLAFIIFFAVCLIAAFIFSHYHSRNIIKISQRENSQASTIFQIHNHIQDINRDIVIIESKVRGLIITQNNDFISGVQDTIWAIQKSMAALNNMVGSENTDPMEKLTNLINRKIRLSQSLMDTFYSKGRASAEAIIATGEGRRLRDSIMMVSKNLESTLQASLEQNLATNHHRAERIIIITAIATGIAVVAIAILTLIIISRIRQQQQMINKQLATEVELIAAKQLADQSARAKEQFLANMSHEIRTPVNSIIGFTTLLQKTNLDSDQSQFVHLVQTASENLLSIINDILDFSKIEAGMLKIENHPFSVRGLCHSIETMFMPQLKEKNLSFSVTVDPGIPDTLIGDAVRLTQILVNLISNSIKFTQEGGVSLKVELLERDHNAKIRFHVHDSGIGIQSDKLEGIFDRFTQGEANTTRKYGGTGLGLSIVKKLIDLQNGTITVQSKPHAGTSFIFDLEYGVDQTDYQPASKPAGSTGADFSQCRILVVEDNQMNQLLLQHTFKAWKVPFQLAADGREAIDCLQKEKFDLVLLDIQMPVMDGYTTARVIRSELKQNIPIIAMTAHAMAGEREKCLVNGMNDYISKPIKEQDLANLIQKYASTKSQSVTTKYSFIDLDFLRELMMGETEFIKTIVQKFSDQFPLEMSSLRQAINNKRVEDVKHIAHDLKSTALFLGKSTPFYNQLEKLEKSAYDSSNWEEIVREFDVLENYSEKVLQETNQLLSSSI